MTPIRRLACAATALLCLAGNALAQAPAADSAQAAAPVHVATVAQPPLAIAIIEWKIKKGHDQEFLDYWALKSTIPDRSGLIGEFLSDEHEATAKFPWINWQTRSTPEYTVYYNVGIWKTTKDYVDQIGKYADNSRDPMPFEYDHRHRVVVEPLDWRRGPASLPDADAPGVK